MKPRIIPTALIEKGTNLVTSQAFVPWRACGSLAQFLKIQVSRHADELILINLPSNDDLLDERVFELIKKNVNVPVSIGGGIITHESALHYISNGADKIIINSLFRDDPDELSAISKTIGEQSLSIKVDYYKNFDDNEFYIHCKNNHQSDLKLKDLVNQIINAPVGEIILCNTEHDGTMKGIDLTPISLFRRIKKPLILMGGACNENDFIKAFNIKQIAGVAAASIFNYTAHTPVTIRNKLTEVGIPVRRI